MRDRPVNSPLFKHFSLDPDFVFLNHGSFGACPRVVLETQRELRARLEAQPVRFYEREVSGLLTQARQRLAEFVNASPDDLGLVTNATTGVNTVLGAITLGRGDELLVTDHEYNACRNALEFVAKRAGASVVVVQIPFPVKDSQTIIDAIMARVTPRTRLMLVDHITSPTGIVMPVDAIVEALENLGVDTLVDGAHAPGMVPLDLRRMRPAYYTGNCHKWLCTPKGSAFLYVREDKQSEMRPLNISHGANMPLSMGSRFRLEFDWTGTCDPTPWLCIPAALDTMASFYANGWADVREHNRALALKARDLLCEHLNQEPPCPDHMMGSLAAVVLPERSDSDPTCLDPLHNALFHDWKIEVPVFAWPALNMRLLRVSAQVYNHPEQYKYLCFALQTANAR